MELKTCGQCKHFSAMYQGEVFGNCDAPLPQWVFVENADVGTNDRANDCQTFAEVDVSISPGITE